KPLTNQDVVLMVKSLMPENVIISAIKTNDTEFDVSAAGLIALRKAGATPKVLEAVLAAFNSKKNGASVPTTAAPAVTTQPAVTAAAAVDATPAGTVSATAPPWQPTVTAFIGRTKVSLPAEATQIVHTKTKATSLSTLAADKNMTQALQTGTQIAQQAVAKTGASLGLAAFNPGVAVLSGVLGRHARVAKTTYVWALAGGSAAETGGNAQMFEVNYSGLPGINADQFEPVIVKLSPTPQANFRLVGATEASTSAEQSTQQDWPIYSSFVEDRLPAKVQKLAYGRARVSAAAALEPGEYAIALRPIDKSKKFAGEDVARNRGEGLLFNYAWPFSVR
ncbi:MAG TPA: hypothetical protein VJA94_07165, partial [Candidatus Angelobacter sp.]